MERVLHAGGFGEHAGAFQKEDVTVDVLALLNEEDLRQLGVARMGQRKRMKELFSNPRKVTHQIFTRPLLHESCCSWCRFSQSS